ncbi:unnamed protein product [Coregonus sp. 'balchen']|nr:unnamed protein product [Coregonus sp. 'balchen']
MGPCMRCGEALAAVGTAAVELGPECVSGNVGSVSPPGPIAPGNICIPSCVHISRAKPQTPARQHWHSPPFPPFLTMPLHSNKTVYGSVYSVSICIASELYPTVEEGESSEFAGNWDSSSVQTGICFVIGRVQPARQLSDPTHRLDSICHIPALPPDDPLNGNL